MDFSKLFERVKAILLTPKSEWPVIAAESASVAGLYTGYIVVLAAIPPLASFLQFGLIGTHVGFFGTYRIGLGTGLTALLVNYALALVGIYALSLIVDALAPTFGGRKDPVMAMKTVAYASTAGWIAGIGQLLPVIAPLIMLAGGVYSIYLCYLGLQVTMQCPEDKAAGYTAAVVLAAIVIGTVAAALTGNFLYRPAMLPAIVASQVAPAVVASQVQSQAATVNQLLQAASAGAGRAVPPLPAASLRNMLPASMPGRTRQIATAQKMGAAGAEFSFANGHYIDEGGRPLTLEIKDTGAGPNALIIGGFSTYEHDQIWDGGYDRGRNEGGRLVQERWDSASGMGRYSVFLSGRFAISATGYASGIEELRAAVAAVDLK